MKKALITIVSFFVLGNIFAQAPVFSWSKGMSGNGTVVGYSVAVDSQRNVYTTGWFLGEADFDPGPAEYNLTSAGGNDIFILKLDSSGNFVWAKKMGGPQNNQVGNDIATDPLGNLYIAGYFNGTVDFDPGPGVHQLSSSSFAAFILKLDSNGNFIWCNSFGGFNESEAYAISVDNAGNVYTTGSFIGNIDFDPGPGITELSSTAGSRDVYIYKLDASGNFIWAKKIGGNLFDKSFNICLDKSGNVYSTGVLNEYSFPLDRFWFALDQSGYDFKDSIFVTKLDANGNTAWIKYMVSDSTAEGNGIVVDASGNVYTCGRFLGKTDFDPGTNSFILEASAYDDIYVSKLNSSGEFVWAKKFNGPATANYWHNGISVCLDWNQDIYLAGYFGDYIDADPNTRSAILNAAGNADILLLKLDKNGNYVWATSMGNNSLDWSIGLASDASNNIYLTGIFNGVVDFDPGQETHNLSSSAGFGAGYILKLKDTNALAIPFIVDKDCNIQTSTSIYPNPSSSILIIDKIHTICKVTMNIYNAAGQLIYKRIPINDGHNEINLANLPAGTYVYRFLSENRYLASGKFIKQH